MTDEGKELIKAGADAAMRPFANLVEKLFGGAVEELGGMWTDTLKVRRFGRQIKLFSRVQNMIEDAGFEPQHIADGFIAKTSSAISRAKCREGRRGLRRETE